MMKWIWLINGIISLIIVLLIESIFPKYQPIGILLLFLSWIVLNQLAKEGGSEKK